LEVKEGIVLFSKCHSGDFPIKPDSHSKMESNLLQLPALQAAQGCATPLPPTSQHIIKN
jgi:hypothetical protein